MNCNQARELISVYREIKAEECESADLAAHLEGCAACRETLANYTRIGEQIRSMPVCEPAPDMHTKLMKALANEQLKVLQKSAPGTVSTPEFLKPYLRQLAEETPGQDEIAAFSTAETGPLPRIQVHRKRRPVQVNQFAVLGLAATILLMLMMGGLTSLLMVARSNPNTITRTSASVYRPTEVDQKIYTMTTLYPNVASALPTRNFIYYTASSNGSASQSWMLMQFDRRTRVSTPLLAQPGSDPLIVLAASDSWLVWLTYSRPAITTHGHVPDTSNTSPSLRTWSLDYLSLQPQVQQTSPATSNTSPSSNSQFLKTPTATSTSSQSTSTSFPTPTLLEQGLFDSTTAPDWVNSPIQGTWLTGNTLLIALIDRHGLSYLESYQLGQTGKAAQVQQIASAPAGHVLTWPTTDSTGTEIYWADEWVSTDGTLHSNIWQQQTSDLTTRSHGHIETIVSTNRQVLMGDGMSFQPQVVDNTLFWLSTSEVTVSGQGAVSPNGTPFPANSTDTSVVFTPRTDTAVYPAPPDSLVHGTIFLLPLDGPEAGVESTLGVAGQSTGFQAGSNYVIWQDTTGYQMYDVQHQSNVVTGDTLNDASLLAVNGNTTLWLTENALNTPGSQLTMMVFNWPN